MAKLNQIIAVEKGAKTQVHTEISELYKAVQKPDLFHGFNKQYQKKDDDDQDLPPESKRVQYTVASVTEQIERSMSKLMNITARKDWTNTTAKSDVTVDSVVILKDVPVSYLLFLEKNLTDIRTFVSKLPVLGSDEDWKKDENTGLFKTPEVKTHRSKKVQKALVLYHATPEHPAQTQIITEDIIAGYWSQVKYSGAIQEPKQKEILERVEKLLNAVKQAREASNAANEIDTPDVGKEVFSYLFG